MNILILHEWRRKKNKFPRQIRSTTITARTKGMKKEKNIIFIAENLEEDALALQ